MESGPELFGKIYRKGEPIFHQDEPGDEMYIIQSGAVEVSVFQDNRKVVVTLLGKGDFFGEMALLDSKPRSATVTAITRTRLLTLSREIFLERANYNPAIILHVLQAICRRIDKMTGQIRTMIDGDEALREMISVGSTLSDFDDDPDHLDTTNRTGIATINKKPVALEGGRGQTLTIESGSIVFEHGDPAERMFYIVQGTVEIFQEGRNGTYRIALLGPQDFFGEIALLTGGRRTASARAVSPVKLRYVHRKEMLAEIQADPQTGLFFLEVLIHRLRTITRAVDAPGDSLLTLRQAIVPRIQKTETVTIGISSLSSCGGCSAALLSHPAESGSILDCVKVRYCPMLMDQDQIKDVKIALVDGVVRTRQDEEKLIEVRSKSHFLIAWGTCAGLGGIPVLANDYELEDLLEESYGETVDPFSYYMAGEGSVINSDSFKLAEHLLRRARTASDVVKVDYYLPGCPPQTHLLEDLFQEMQGNPVPTAGRRIVCVECKRKTAKRPVDYPRIFPTENETADLCFLSQGSLCLGFISRGGCRAACTGSGLPCWGCRGPSNSIINKIIKGDLFEELVLDQLSRRLKTDKKNLKGPIRNLRFKGCSALGFSSHFPKDTTRIR